MTIQALSIPDTAACKTCGYLLRGLCEPRCPECGKPFDPDDPKTYNARPARRFVQERWPVLACCCVLGIFGNLLLNIPVSALVMFPWLLLNDSTFANWQIIPLLLTISAFAMVCAHPVHPNRVTACITVVGSIGWYLLAGFVYAAIAWANC
ncbi:MAG: hypothetical protein JSU63_00910 [Phycisphaerales bacterium]|nr:MAG: hypothetical protein JSU63_00910 [Phycisphaerales bacterium]